MGLPLAQYAEIQHAHTCYCAIHCQRPTSVHRPCGHWFILKGLCLQYIPVGLLHDNLLKCLSKRSFRYWAFKRFGSDPVPYSIVLLFNRDKFGLRLEDLSSLHLLADIECTEPQISPLLSCKDVPGGDGWVLSCSMDGMPLSTLWKCT